MKIVAHRGLTQEYNENTLDDIGVVAISFFIYELML